MEMGPEENWPGGPTWDFEGASLTWRQYDNGSYNLKVLPRQRIVDTGILPQHLTRELRIVRHGFAHYAPSSNQFPFDIEGQQDETNNGVNGGRMAIPLTDNYKLCWHRCRKNNIKIVIIVTVSKGQCLSAAGSMWDNRLHNTQRWYHRSWNDELPPRTAILGQ